MRSPLLRVSVRSRILAVILVVTALGMTVAGLTAYLVQRDRVLASIDTELISSVEAARAIVTGETTANEGSTTAAPEAEPAGFATVEEALSAIMSRLVPGRNESSVALIDGEARLIPGTRIAFHLEDDPAFIDRAWQEASGGVVTLGTAVTQVGTLRYIAAPVSVADDDQVGVYVTAVDAQAAVDEVGGAFLTYAGLALLSLAAIGVAGWFVAGRLLSPLRDLTETASRITAAELSERIPVHGNDDVSALTETVNAMLERLDESLTAQRQLLDDVRHELKTPLTIVRGHLELMDPRNPADVDSARQIAIDELDRMSELVDDIDALARAERAQLLTEPTDVADFTALVFSKASAMSGHDWQLAESAEAIAPLSPSRLTQAWLQLADNAAKYSPPSSTIRLGSTAYATAVEFWVADEGPGIPEGAEERIFERFGRADTGRGIAGSGLGLPIVAAIARAHGGYVTLDSSGAGARFGIVLPTGAEQDAPPPPAAGFGGAEPARSDT
ncbi:MAG: ATP-binding protein [Microcella sp.]|uniref:sensor histidine kinase n=1 Tax=Microcella sp. TaxID=1913979 RepID=UPI003314FF0F